MGRFLDSRKGSPADAEDASGRSHRQTRHPPARSSAMNVRQSVTAIREINRRTRRITLPSSQIDRNKRFLLRSREI
jgi:hypothetical protein